MRAPAVPSRVPGPRARAGRLRARVTVAVLVLAAGRIVSEAQELEPRRWSHLPIDAQYAGAGYAFTVADIYFDPVLEIKDVRLDLHTVAAKYIRTGELLGRSVRVDLTAPCQDARWEGLLRDEPASVERTGFADPTLRFTVNLTGAPPLKGEDFVKYRVAHPVNTLAGAALAVRMPLGQYYEDKLLNLGENRFTVRPELGVLHTRHKWSFEVTGSAGIYTDNEDFMNGNRRAQDPYFFLQSHAVYTFRPGLWLGVAAALGTGGASSINGVDKQDTRGDEVWSLGMGCPISRSTGIKVAYVNSRTRESTGMDSDTLAVAFSVLW